MDALEFVAAAVVIFIVLMSAMCVLLADKRCEEYEDVNE